MVTDAGLCSGWYNDIQCTLLVNVCGVMHTQQNLYDLFMFMCKDSILYFYMIVH